MQYGHRVDTEAAQALRYTWGLPVSFSVTDKRSIWATSALAWSVSESDGVMHKIWIYQGG